MDFRCVYKEVSTSFFTWEVIVRESVVEFIDGSHVLVMAKKDLARGLRRILKAYGGPNSRWNRKFDIPFHELLQEVS